MGCSPGTQIEDLAITLCTGIDEEKNGIKLTSEIVNSGTSSSKDSSGKSMMYLVESITEKNVTDALFKQRLLHPKEIFPQHNQVIVFGENTLKKGITDLLSELARTKYVRGGVYLVTAKGKAHDLLKATSIENQSISDSIVNLLNREGVHTKVAHVLERASSTQQGFVLTLLDTLEVEGKKRILVSGGAVVDQGKLAGYLDEKEMKLVSLLLNQKPDLRVTIKYENKPVEVVLDDSNFQLDSVLTSDKPTFFYNGTLSFHVYKASLGRLATTEDIANIQTLVRTELNQQLTTLMNKMLEEYRCDAMGFGDHLYRYRPSYWKKHQKAWHSMLPVIEIIFNTDVTIKNLGVHA